MTVQILIGDARHRLKDLADESVHCVVTSPPYFGLRDYGVAGQMGLEATPEAFVAELVDVFREVRRVLRADGTCWINLGDSYAGSGRGGNPTEASSTLEGGQETQRASMISRTRGSRLPGGLKQKDLVGAPWLVAFALRADGWWLRQDIIWSKPNPMPESVTDRCTKAHEYLFLLSKSQRYFYDADAITEGLKTDASENYPARARITGRGTQGAAAARGNDQAKSGRFPPRRRGVPPRHAHLESSDQSGLDDVGRGFGRNRRSVWTVATQPFSEAHFATFPPALIEPCILAGCPEGGTVLDPFGGAGTTALVASRHGRNAILIELNPAYAAMAEKRLKNDGGMFAEVHHG